jgi:hypothetical protein
VQQEGSSKTVDRHSHVKRETLGRTFRVFITIFIPIAAFTIFLIWLFLHQDRTGDLNSLLVRESSQLDASEKKIRNAFDSAMADLHILAGGLTLRTYLESSTEPNRSILGESFLLFLANRGLYDQIRYINEDGQEEVRVNYQNGKPNIVSIDKLQNKSNRYYFSDAIILDPGSVFISPFDLNMEKGEIEKPYKPMIRMAMPVVDGKGKKRGIVILNYLGDNLLKTVRDSLDNSLGIPMLLNSESFWLLGATRQDEWGFMFGNETNFLKRFPDQHEIMSSNAGQIVTNQGLFTFRTIYPLSQKYFLSDGKRVLKLALSHRKHTHPIAHMGRFF